MTREGLVNQTAVYVDTHITAPRQKPVRRKILLWKRVNLGSLQATISEFTTDFVKSMWLIRIMELSLPGGKVPSWELSLPQVKSSRELSLPRTKVPVLVMYNLVSFAPASSISINVSVGAYICKISVYTHRQLLFVFNRSSLLPPDVRF